MTRSQKLTLPNAPFMLSPIDQRLWLRDSGHWSETVLLYTPVAASSAKDGKVGGFYHQDLGDGHWLNYEFVKPE